MWQKIAAILLLCCYALIGESQILVKPNGTGNGKSWAQPMDLQSALASANSGAEIWLRSGTYFPTKCTTCSESDRKISFEIPDGVKILGGFSGIENRKEQRNPKQNPTILSGDIDEDSTFKNNSYSIITTENVSFLMVADGLIIRDGNADGDHPTLEDPTRSGAGWYNGGLSTSQSNPTIRNCIFENNQAFGFGGAMYNMGAYDGVSEPTYENCIFRNNQVQFDGASIYSNGSFGGTANFVMTDCLFEDNLAGWEVGGGAALFNNGIEGGCNPIITNCTFIRQHGTLHGGAIYNQGKGGDASPIITNCVFYKNEAIQAGAIFNLGAFPGSNSSPIITNCTFYGNVAYDFGGVSTVNGDVNGHSYPIYRNCIFSNNIGEKSGDVFYMINGHPTIEYCLVDQPDCETMADAFANLSEVTCLEGMIYEKPTKFVDPANGNLHLKYNSSALNMGNDSFNLLDFDRDYQERITLGQIDLGAYEYTGHEPTQMESFSAQTNDNFVKLDWVSRVEFENAGFEVQRSRDTINWETVSWVNSQGNSTRRLLYSAFDAPPQRGEIYTYRLKQVDNDSCFNFFGLDTAFVRPNEVLIKLFPTPTKRFISLKIYYPRDNGNNNLKLFVANSIGQVFIQEEQTGLSKGWTTLTFDLKNTASGIHYFHVNTNGKEVTLPFALTNY